MRGITIFFQWAAGILLAGTILAATWDGGGGDDNWSTGLNWGGVAPTDGDSLDFGGVTRLTNTNDLLTSSSHITFLAGAGNFTLNPAAGPPPPLTLNGNVRNFSVGSLQTINLDLDLAGNAPFINASDGDITLNGILSNGSIQPSGGNTIILAGDNTISGVSFNTNPGGIDTIVRLAHDNAAGTGNILLRSTRATLELADGVTIPNDLTVGNNGNTKILRLQPGAATAEFAGDVSLTETTNALFHVRPSGGTLTLSGDVSGTGFAANEVAININSAGTVILSGNNSFRGDIRLQTDAAVLVAASNNALSTHASTNVLLNATGTVLELTDGVSTPTDNVLNVQNTGGNKILRLAAGATSAEFRGRVVINETGAGNFDVDTNGGDLTLSGVISGGGAAGLTKVGLGTLTLSGNNTFTQRLVFDEGTLVQDVTIAGQQARRLTFNAGADVYRKTGAEDLLVTSGGSIVSMGSGGLFHVEEALFTFGFGGIGDWSANQADLRVDAGAEFRGSATPIVVDALTGGGTVSAGAGLTLGVDGGSGTFSGTLINDPGGFAAVNSLTKSGAGSQTLSGANSYTGLTTVNAGILRIENDDALGTTATGTLVNTGGRLQVFGNRTIDEDVTINGAGAGGALQFIGGDSAWNGDVTLGSTSSIGVTGSNVGTLTGALNGTDTLRKVNSGTLAIDTDTTATFTGDVDVDGGAIRLQNGGSLNGADSFTVNAAGATLDLDGGNPTFAPDLAGIGTLRNSAGSNTLTGSNGGFTGAYDIQADRLIIDSPAAFGDPGRVNIATGATFDLTSPAFGGAVDGSGATGASTRYTGTGTIDAGANTFQWSGGTTIAPGNSPGVMSVIGNVDWSGATTPGGTYDWEVFDGTGAPTGGSGTGWDLIDITGSLDLTGGADTINAIGLAALPNTAGLPTNVNMDPGFSPKETTFEIIRTTGGITGLDSFTPSFINNMNHPGYFELYSNGFSLFLVWIPTPEPGTWALFGLLLAGAACTARRRKRAKTQ